MLTWNTSSNNPVTAFNSEVIFSKGTINEIFSAYLVQTHSKDKIKSINSQNLSLEYLMLED